MKFKESLFKGIFFVSALVSIVAVLVICVFLFANGLPAMKEIGLFDFIFGTQWRPTNDMYGIFPMIVGSIYITAGAIIIGVPIGILTAVFMCRYVNGKIYKYLKPMIDLLASIPSIIYGFFGMTMIVPLIRNTFPDYTNGNSILAASIILGIMILPTIISISEASLRAVPEIYYEGSRALGATHERSIFVILIKAARSGILASVILGVGRAIGETMAVIMIAGNQPRLTANVLEGIRTMTANVVLEMKYAAGLHQEALIATGVVLFVFILLINLSFSIIKRKSEGLE